MITITKGDLFQSGCEAIVNAVNCVGVMGGGIALAFKQKYPEMFEDYALICASGELKPGILHTYRVDGLIIINFPTKDKVQFNSEISYIELGLETLKSVIEEDNIKSIAIPALGSGLGGLNWDDVKPIIINALEDLDCDIQLYEPW